MNTPAHILISTALLCRKPAPPNTSTCFSAAVLGAVVPDGMMFVFYAVEKFIFQSTEREIWSQRYFTAGWQDIFDVFNSVPIVILGLAIAWRLGNRWTFVFLASMLIHFVLDLPLHHDDGHRHFFPLSDWRFESPVSYWDPKHFGIPMSVFEVVLSSIAAYFILRREQRSWPRAFLVLMMALEVMMLAGLWYFVVTGGGEGVS